MHTIYIKEVTMYTCIYTHVHTDAWYMIKGVIDRGEGITTDITVVCVYLKFRLIYHV